MYLSPSHQNDFTDFIIDINRFILTLDFFTVPRNKCNPDNYTNNNSRSKGYDEHSIEGDAIEVEH